MSEKPTITVRGLPGEPEYDATGCFDIQIGKGGTMKVLRVSVSNGWVEINSEWILNIQPIASNCIRVKPEYGL